MLFVYTCPISEQYNKTVDINKIITNNYNRLVDSHESDRAVNVLNQFIQQIGRWRIGQNVFSYPVRIMLR